MRKSIWKWLLPALFTLGGMLVGLAYYYRTGCASGNCAITASPLRTMLYMGLIGLLISMLLPTGCNCNKKEKKHE